MKNKCKWCENSQDYKLKGGLCKSCQRFIYTTMTLAKKFNIPRRTIERWRYANKGPPYYRNGKYCYYNINDFAKWLDKVITSSKILVKYPAIKKAIKFGLLTKLSSNCSVCGKETQKYIQDKGSNGIWELDKEIPICSLKCESEFRSKLCEK